MGKVRYLGEVKSSGVFSIFYFQTLRVTMLIDVERVCKTLGKVTPALVFIMFHGATLQGNKETLQTECLFEPYATDAVSISELSRSQEFARKDKSRRAK